MARRKKRLGQTAQHNLMKEEFRMKNRIRIAASVALALVVSACGTEQAGLSAGAKGNQDQDGMTFSKTIELVDASGLNSATATLRSPDQALLDEVDAESLTLVAVYEDDVVVEEDLADEEAAVLPMGELIIELGDEIMAEGVVALEIVENGSPAYRAPFKWRYSYSKLDCVDVTRTSFWHKTYTSIWYKATSGSSWSTVVSGRLLRNNETLSRCKSGSYKLKVGVEARRTSHYAVEFWD